MFLFVGREGSGVRIWLFIKILSKLEAPLCSHIYPPKPTQARPPTPRITNPRSAATSTPSG